MREVSRYHRLSREPETRGRGLQIADHFRGDGNSRDRELKGLERGFLGSLPQLSLVFPLHRDKVRHVGDVVIIMEISRVIGKQMLVSTVARVVT